MSDYRLEVSGPAERSLDQLPPKVAAAIVEFMTGPLLEVPHRVGKPLQRELAGLRSARRSTYRVVYRVDEDSRTVRVVRIDHRSRVYRAR